MTDPRTGVDEMRERLTALADSWMEDHDATIRYSNITRESCARELRRVLACLDSHSPQDSEPRFVKMPENEDEAALMALLGESWLREHAPHRLRSPDSEPSGDVPALVGECHECGGPIYADEAWSSAGPTIWHAGICPPVPATGMEMSDGNDSE